MTSIFLIKNINIPGRVLISRKSPLGRFRMDLYVLILSLRLIIMPRCKWLFANDSMGERVINS